MSIVRLKNVQISYGGPPLLDQVTLNIDAGERCCVLGRNGVGKSTLMKLIAGEIQADVGRIEFQAGLKVARLVQEVPTHEASSVYQVVAQGLGEVGQWLSDYQTLSHALADGSSDALIHQLAEIQHKIENHDGWSLNQKVDTSLDKLQLSGDAPFSELSGGMKRRVMLAQALVNDPDLLLLDEPTNHLDIRSIDWMENFLSGYSGTLLFITHDRTFLQRLATRIIELDRGGLTSWACDYPTYLERKAAALAAEAQQDARFDKKLAQEEVWIRQGIKARRTRNEGRVRALEKMRTTYGNRRKQIGQAKMQIEDAKRSGKVVIEAENIHFSYQERSIIRDFSTLVLRGDKLGIMGPNGAGKTTLIQILLGQLRPDSGQVALGTQLHIAYFDQLRAKLDDEKSVMDNLAEGRQQIEINGKAKHVISYLQDFLFTPDRIRSPVKSLSGGERNRLLLARLFATPSNFLVLDEPTNDLDVETLELLEERLSEYQGTILLVTHDRTFLNHVVTGCLVFEHDGQVSQYVGGYDDWLRQRKADEAQAEKTTSPLKTKRKVGKERPRKISFSEQHELSALPKRIESLERAQANLQAEIVQPDFYQQNQTKIQNINQQLSDIETELTSAYKRWEILESLVTE